MTVKLNLNNIYNIETKEEYLKTYSNLNTQKSVLRIFRTTTDMEHELDKDLYNFTREEIISFLEETSPKTKTSARNFGRMIHQYLQWAVDTGRIDEHPFPVQQHYYTRFAKQDHSVFMDKKELRYYTHYYLQNAQDGIILELLFHGIQGKEANEIRNLTVDDIDESNLTITVYDDSKDRRRTIQFEDNKVIQYCLDAHKEEEYYKKNKEMEETPRIRPYAELMQTKYILKNAKTNTVHDDRTKQYTIYNRLKNMKKFKEMEEIKHKLTIKNIVKSGQLYMASKLYERDGELTIKQRREIAERFGMKEHWSMTDYLNEDVLFKVYPSVKKFKK